MTDALWCKMILRKNYKKRSVMNLQNDFTKLNSNIQETFKNWDNKILPYLPKQMDELAKGTGAMQRKRGVCSCADLLRMLFLYASSNF